MREWLIQSDATIAEEARKGRWLSVLLLTFTVLTLIVVLGLWLIPQLQLARAVWINVITFFVFAGLYWVNRRGWVRISAVGILLIITINILVVALFLNTGLAAALALPAMFVIVIAAAGVFLTWRWVAVTVAILSVVTFIYYLGDIRPCCGTTGRAMRWGCSPSPS